MLPINHDPVLIVAHQIPCHFQQQPDPWVWNILRWPLIPLWVLTCICYVLQVALCVLCHYYFRNKDELYKWNRFVFQIFKKNVNKKFGPEPGPVWVQPRDGQQQRKCGAHVFAGSNVEDVVCFVLHLVCSILHPLISFYENRSYFKPPSIPTMIIL